MRLLANDKTGLAEDDVFYFGSAIGECGDSTANALVNATDVGLVRNNLSGFFSVDVENLYDLDRNGFVNATDVGIARSNLSGFFPILLITPTDGSSIRKVTPLPEKKPDLRRPKLVTPQLALDTVVPKRLSR